jgi:hypothetical protein
LLAAKEDADLRYITDRCIEPESARDAAFLKDYGASPQNPWLALAAGYSFAEQSQWGDAAKALDLARKKLPETAEFVALDLARVKRMSEGEKAKLADIMRDSEQLRDLLKLETGAGISGAFLAYKSLAQGKFAEALQHASGSPELQSEMTLLVAASEGASSELAAKVLNQPVTEDIPAPNAWYLLGLAARSQVNTAPYRALIVKREPDLEELVNQFDGLARVNPAQFETQLLRVPFTQRRFIYAAAVIALGDHAPVKWREYAKRMLFAAERPYF